MGSAIPLEFRLGWIALRVERSTEPELRSARSVPLSLDCAQREAFRGARIPLCGESRPYRARMLDASIERQVECQAGRPERPLLARRRARLSGGVGCQAPERGRPMEGRNRARSGYTGPWGTLTGL